MDFGAISLAYQLNCPSCGALVKFASRASVYAVCEFCKSMLVRHDMNLEDLGKVAILQNDSSPFQIGTQGIYNRKPFTLIGRVRMNWDDGFWNEWHMYFNGDQSGWLAEAQGFYMVSFETTKYKDLPTVENLRPDLEVMIDKKSYVVDDIKQAECAFSEGELPFKAATGIKITSADLTGPSEEFASLSYSQEGIQVYVGRYVQMEEMKVKNMREFDGWRKS